MFSRAVCSQPHTFDKYIRGLFAYEKVRDMQARWRCGYDAGYKV